MSENTLPPRVSRWTQKLLDLSLRNRLLNVRDSKCVLPLACRDVSLLEDKLASDAEVPIAFADPVDNLLVSSCTEAETKKRLKYLFRLAKTDLEESGVNTLFLALGFLNWKSSAKDAKTDRAVDETHAAIPSLLAVSAVHHYLISIGKRVQTALIVESGEIRETMHAALLLGYGASAICPYMTFAILDDLVKRHKIQEDYATAEANYIKAVRSFSDASGQGGGVGRYL